MPTSLRTLPLTLLLAGCAAGGGPATGDAQGGTFTLRAHGNEPAWTLAIDAALRFEAERLHVDGPALPVHADGPVRRYAAALRDRAIPVAVEVAVTPGVCRDSMSGMPHPLRVEVVVGERRFRGCGGEPTALLQGSEWTVSELAGVRVEQSAPTLRFRDDGRVGGRASCNTYHANYTLTGETLTIGRAASTRMACPPPQMAQEQRFFELLHEVRRFDVADDGSLLLIDGSGRAIRSRR